MVIVVVRSLHHYGRSPALALDELTRSFGHAAVVPPMAEIAS